MKAKKGLMAKAVFGVMLGLAVQLVEPSVAMAVPHYGSFERVDRVEANQTRVFNVVLKGNETTRIALFGDRSTDLDLIVFDDQGRKVTEGVGVTDQERVTVRPDYTGTYRVEVRNLGNVWNQYTIVFN